MFVPPSACRKNDESSSFVVASWLMASSPRTVAVREGAPLALRPNHSIPS